MAETTVSEIDSDPPPPSDLRPRRDSYSCARDYHLFGPGSKRILALDGGGVRGAISVAFLERIEQIFAQRQRNLMARRRQEPAGAHNGGGVNAATALGTRPVRLADHFDLIGGTSAGTRLTFEQLGFLLHPRLAMRAALSLMADAEIMTLALMQWFGRCDAPWDINSDVLDLRDDLPGGRQDWFRFMRYDLRLEKTWLKKSLGLTLSDRDLARLHRMDDARNIKILYELAQVAAQIQVKEEHFFPRRGTNSAPSVAAP